MGLFSWLGGGKPAAPAEPELEQRPPSAGELDAALDSPDGALRVDAVAALLEGWRGGDAEAASALAPRLAALLRDPEPLVRGNALAATRLLRKEENLEACAAGVLACLDDPAPPVRTSAVWAAVRLPGDAGRTRVRGLLGGTDEPLRFAAACALADAGDAAAIPALLRAAAEDVRRQEALSALLSLGDPAALPELQRLFGLEDERSGGKAIEAFDRTLLAAVLARLGDPRGGAWLVERIEAAGDDSPVAAEWAGRLRLREAIPALEAAADEEGGLARGAALRALGRLSAPSAEARLSALADDPATPEDLRLDAAEGLAELGTPTAAATLARLSAGEGELAALCGELVAELSAATPEASR